MTETVPLEVDKDETIGAIKLKLQEVNGLAINKQRYVYQGKQLEDGRTLSDYNIEDESTIHLILRLG